MTTIGVNVTTALEELAARHDGRLTPEVVLRAAKRAASPFHHLFEWDDTAAARLYRLDQARRLLREVKLSVEVEPERSIDVRGFVHVKAADDDEGYYAPTREALSDHRRTIVMEQARRDIVALERKYHDLIDFAALLDEEAKRVKRRAA